MWEVCNFALAKRNKAHRLNREATKKEFFERLHIKL